MYVQVSLLHPGPLFRHCDSDRRFLHLVDGVQVQGGVIDGFCTVLHCTVLYCAVLYCTVLYCRYGLEGWLEDLPQLNVGRFEHGCGSYVSGADMVSI